MYMISHTGNIENVQYIQVQKHCSRVTDQIQWKYLQCDGRGRRDAAFKSHPKAMFLCFEWLNTLGRWFMNKKAPGGPWQSNVGVLYLPEYKWSPHMQNKCWKESEGLSGRSEMSWGLWENPRNVCWWQLASLCPLIYIHWYKHAKTHVLWHSLSYYFLSAEFKIQISKISHLCGISLPLL